MREWVSERKTGVYGNMWVLYGQTQYFFYARVSLSIFSLVCASSAQLAPEQTWSNHQEPGNCDFQDIFHTQIVEKHFVKAKEVSNNLKSFLVEENYSVCVQQNVRDINNKRMLQIHSPQLLHILNGIGPKYANNIFIHCIKQIKWCNGNECANIYCLFEVL